jgi:hypothetical protein
MMERHDLPEQEALRHRYLGDGRPELVHADVLIIGSGPAGCTFARQLVEGNPDKKVLMVDLGAQMSRKPGTNAKNVYLYNYSEDGLDTLAQIVRGELTYTSQPLQDPWPEALDPISQPLIPPVK